GLTFLLPAQLAFSLWGFFVLYRLSYVYIAWLGAGATGFWGSWESQIAVFETGGATFVLCGFILWTARRPLAAWWRRVRSGRREEGTDLLGPRAAALLLAGGIGGMAAWFMLAGAQWWAGLAAVLVFLATNLVLTRVAAEMGFMLLATSLYPFDFITALVPAAWLTGPTVSVLALSKGVLMHDFREILMPYVMNGLKACDQARVKLGGVVRVFAVTAVLALVISAYGRVATYYKYGGVNMDEWANVSGVQSMLGAGGDYLKNPPRYELMKAGDLSLAPASVAHVGVGAALMGGLLFLRAAFPWWPLHPLGFVICTCWVLYWAGMWFSIFLGWAAKSAVMRFGGASAYRRFLPFALGLVLGESVIALVWTLISLATGTPNVPIMPN
ncbi:MAG: DUF6785 family protein, partial [bacterium]